VGVYRRPRPRHRTTGGAGPARADAAKRDSARRSGNPRRAAYDVLAAVESREAYANLLLPKLLADRDITGRDAALATELAYGTLRGQGTYDAVLAACSDRPLDKLDPPVRLVLRLGAHQLLGTRIGAHAAVATSVDLIKSVAGHGPAGYVNAVLRRVATRDADGWLEIVAPDSAADHDGQLAIRYSHPRWIVAAYRDALDGASPLAAGGLEDLPSPSPRGQNRRVPQSEDRARSWARGEEDELEAALAAGNARPRVTMATFPGGPPRDVVMPPGAEPGRWSPYAFTLDSGNPADLIDSGQAAAQDEASQLAAIALTRAPLATEAAGADGHEELWLDLCAGPGGKTRLLYGLAGLAGNGTRRAHLIAAELHPRRAALVADTLARASRSRAGQQVVVADGTRPPWPAGVFDRVLVDAPCSGLGALRRRPEARWRKSASDIPALAELQGALLRSALAAVRPGGVVAYVTCSPVPAETRDVVNAVVSADPGIEILDAPAVLADVPDVRSPSPLFAQLWPHRHGTDAIFIALLRRGTQ
jgi:16S rRNA (cytosine967-C5)-methyltransferase